MPQPKLSRRSTGLPPTRVELEEQSAYQSIRPGKHAGEPDRQPQDNQKYLAAQHREAVAKLKLAVAEIARHLSARDVEILRVYSLEGSYQLVADVRIGTVAELWEWQCGEWRGRAITAARRLTRP